IGFGAYAIVHKPNHNTATVVPTTPSPSETVSPSPSASPTVPTVGATFPRLAIFPFTTAAQEKTWQKQAANGSQPWVADPKAVATNWVQNILQLPSVNQVLTTTSQPGPPKTTDVTLGRTLQAENHKPFAVTVVHLVQFGHA